MIKVCVSPVSTTTLVERVSSIKDFRLSDCSCEEIGQIYCRLTLTVGWGWGRLMMAILPPICANTSHNLPQFKQAMPLTHAHSGRSSC